MPNYPYEFLKTFVRSGAHSTCFVLMPFAPTFDTVYEAVCEACASSELLLACERADDFFNPGNIMEDILKGIVGADFIVADVTGKNPNVFYELGIAHSCRDARSVVIITQSLDDVPFDLRHMRCIVYRDDPGGLRGLRADVERALSSVSQDIYRFAVTEHESFPFPDRLTGDRRNFYRFTVGNLHLRRGSAKFSITVHRESLTDGNTTEEPHYHYLEEGESVQIPHTDWSLRLDRTTRNEAYFCVARGAA